MKKMIFVYIVAASKKEANNISRTLLKESLVACTNQWSPMISRFFWQGKFMELKETALIAKTSANLFEKVRRRVKEMHSYDTPCIVSLNVSRGDLAYLSWMQASLKRSFKKSVRIR